MLKQTITFKSLFDNKEETQDFYFHLTEMEAIEINLMDDLREVMNSKDPQRIIPTFKRIVRAAVGERRGELFMKNENYAAAFLASDAYSKLFTKILEAEDSTERMATFVKGIIPADLNTEPTLPESTPEATPEVTA